MAFDFLLMTPLCPEVCRVIHEQRSLLKSAGDAARNRISMVANGTKRAPVVVLMESQAGTLIKRKRLGFPWFSMAHRVIAVEERLLMPPAAGTAWSGPGMQDTNAHLLQRFLGGKSLSPCPGELCFRNLGLEQVPMNPQGSACCEPQEY